MDFCLRLGTTKILEGIKEDTKKNLVFSPFTTNCMLNMVASGSEGDSLRQLLHFLDSQDIDDVNTRSSRMIALATTRTAAAEDSGKNQAAKTVADEDSGSNQTPEGIGNDRLWERTIGTRDKKGVTLTFAGGIWIDRQYPLKPSFQKIAKDVYRAEAKAVDFKTQAKQVEKEINLWAETESNGLIKELIEPGRLCGKPEPTFVLANALYFKGAWDDPFEPSSSDMNFHLLDGGTIRVPFLSGYYRYEYYGSFETLKVLRLPYGTGNDLDKRFSMYFFLPNRSNGLQDMIQEFNSEPGLFHKRTKLEKVDIAWLRIPKFKFSNTFTLSETMKELGLTLPFQMGGGPTGMVDWERVNCPNAQYMLKISMIIQKSFIEVNEDGTEAAACDEDDDMGFSLEPLPKPKPLYFDADHPFMFMIKEDISDIVFFTGAVLNPLEQN
ncbi:hypothetical protein Tsubulata_019263 [Turnera subulata]|uniref:Serpin domain-containing protein n=1 Tax=Turnera subulata TaxID=218843 RepID=A0A9Q0FKP7_9ROSI|nr:hypothetical protein Tsubulata_019263 [Turnera subulata]